MSKQNQILLQKNIRAAFKEVNKIKALLENIDARLAQAAKQTA